MRFPSIGLAELVILAGIAGLVTLVVAIVIVAVVRRRKTGDAGPWKWIALLGLILIVLPLAVFIVGVLLVTPVRVERSYAPTAQAVVVTVAPEVTATPSGVGVTGTPPTPMAPPNPSPDSDPGARSLSIVPVSALEVLGIPLVIASLVLLTAGAIVAVVLRTWAGSDPRPEDADGRGDRRTRLRYVFLALAFWTALSLLLILDLGLGLAVSIYPRFLAIYAAFWVLLGALLLHGRPTREKVLILALFAAVLASVRFIDWNSRKPFLRDLHSINEGMTRAQVEGIMGRYIRSGGRPLAGPETELDESGQILTGTVTYRHTNEGWGDSDWGVVTFVDGRVVETEFLPD
jgi:hypothetical protein